MMVFTPFHIKKSEKLLEPPRTSPELAAQDTHLKVRHFDPGQLWCIAELFIAK
jgi:hypothetical protein